MEPTKRCPFCGEIILRIAIRCKHCQADLRGVESNDYPPVQQPELAPAVYPAHAPAPPGAGGFVASGAELPVVGPPPVLPPSPDFAQDMGQGAAAAPAPAAFPPAAPPAGEPVAAPHPYVAPTEGTFEQRFLDFAFKTSLPISAATVAYALKIPIDEADEGLQDLVVRDVLLRDVDSRGVINYALPGRSAVAAATASSLGVPNPGTALSPYSQPPQLLYDPPGSLNGAPTENTALAGLLVNVCFPGLGSLIGGKTSAGVFQLLMFLLGLPLCIVVIGAPMVIGAWIWGLVTGVNMLNEAKQGAQRRSLVG